MRDSEAVVTPFMQVATYATRNFAHTIPIFRSGMDFLFIQFAHMRYNHYVYALHQMGALHKQSTLDTQRKVSEDPKDFCFPADYPISCTLPYTSIKVPAYIPKILVSCGLSNLLHFYCIQVSKAHTMHTIFVHRIYPKDFGFLRIDQSLVYYCIQVSRFAHISQKFWFPTDYPISCILLHTSIKVSAYMFALCNHVYCIQVSRALRSFPHIVGLHFFLTKKGGSIYLRTVKVTAAV